MDKARTRDSRSNLNASAVLPAQTEASAGKKASASAVLNAPLFENPFTMDDLLVFDDATMGHILSDGGFGLKLDDIAVSLHGVPDSLLNLVMRNVPSSQRVHFLSLVGCPASSNQVQDAQRRVLDALFWELTYWKTPELYEELTEGERLHPGIFKHLEPDVRNKVVLDVGAGSGRATLECLRYGAKIVYAVEPSPGLLHLLEKKLGDERIVPYQGRFDQIPLADRSVDTALSCSAFTAQSAQSGESGLAELKRVTKAGGKIVFIWPRQEDYDWFIAHGFHYVALPIHQEMRVRFRSLQSALRCARLFYARNRAVLQYLLTRRRPEVPFSVIGVNPPCDYCWLTVE